GPVGPPDRQLRGGARRPPAHLCAVRGRDPQPARSAVRAPPGREPGRVPQQAHRAPRRLRPPSMRFVRLVAAATLGAMGAVGGCGWGSPMTSVERLGPIGPDRLDVLVRMLTYPDARCRPSEQDAPAAQLGPVLVLLD